MYSSGNTTAGYLADDMYFDVTNDLHIGIKSTNWKDTMVISPTGGVTITGNGTGTGQALLVEDSTGDSRFFIQDNGIVAMQSNIAGEPAFSTLKAVDSAGNREGNIQMGGLEGTIIRNSFETSGTRAGMRLVYRSSSFSAAFFGDSTMLEKSWLDINSLDPEGMNSRAGVMVNSKGANEYGFMYNSQNVTASNAQLAFGYKQMTGATSQTEALFIRPVQYNYSGAVFDNSTDGIGQQNLFIYQYSNQVRPIFATDHAHGFTYTTAQGFQFGKWKSNELGLYAVEAGGVNGFVNSPKQSFYTAYDTTTGGVYTNGRLEAYIQHTQSVAGLNPISQLDFNVAGAVGMQMWSDGTDSFPEAPEYTVATLPPVGNGSTGFSGLIVVTDATGGQSICSSNGTNWIDARTGVAVV